MKAILTLAEIKRLVAIPQLIQEIESGFVLFSEGQANIPPVGFLKMENPPGDVHIKYGCLHNDDYYVLKVASAFYDNPAQDLPQNNGIIVLFSSTTGGIEYLLLDEGWLTDMRTAAAGAVAAKHLANRTTNTIGIVGTGLQGRLQFKLLQQVVDSRRCLIWGRDLTKAKQMAIELGQKEYDSNPDMEILATDDLEFLLKESQLVVTTTSAETPIIKAEHVQPGTHITAMGSDDYGKQELESDVLAKADIVVADSISQCVDHGECRATVQHGLLDPEQIVELGQLIANPKHGRTRQDQITIADLTGVAVQDIQIAKMVATAHRKNHATGAD